LLALLSRLPSSRRISLILSILSSIPWVIFLSITIPVLERYLGKTDPLARDYIKIDRGSIRFLKYEPYVHVDNVFTEDKVIRVPIGITSGEISYVNADINRVIRETRFREHDSENGIFVYDLPYEYKDGTEFKKKDIRIGFYYYTGVVSEHYVDSEYKTYTRFGIPLYRSQFKGDTELVHSRYTTRVYVNEEGKVFMYHSEIPITDTPTFGLTNVLIYENDFISREVITDRAPTKGLGAIVPDALRYHRFIHFNVYEDSNSEKWRNSFIESIYHSFIPIDKSSPEYIIDEINNSTTALELDLIDSNIIQLDGKDYDLNQRESLPVYSSLMIAVLQNLVFIIIGIFIAGFVLIRYLSKGHFKRTTRKNFNFKTLPELIKLIGGNKEIADALARRILRYRVLRIVIDRNITQGIEDRIESINEMRRDEGRRESKASKALINYIKLRRVITELTIYGFDVDEARILAQLYVDGKITLKSQNKDYTKFKTPKFDADNASDLIDQAGEDKPGTVGKLKKLTRMVIAASRGGHERAMIIAELKEKGLITQDDIEEAAKLYKINRIGLATPDSIRWFKVYNHLINKVEYKALEDIRNAKNTDQIRDALKDLPETPQVNVLNAMIDILGRPGLGIPTVEEMVTEAGVYSSLYNFAQGLLRYQVIKPIVGDVVNGDQGIQFAIAHDRERLVNTVFAYVQASIFKNPSLLIDLANTGDLTFNQYPMNPSAEVTTLRKISILKLLHMNKSQTEGVTFGGANLHQTYLVYLTDKIDAMQKSEIYTKDQIIEFIKASSELFTFITIYERYRYKQRTESRPAWVKGLLTERIPNLFTDQDIFNMFEFIQQDGTSFYDVIREHSEEIEVDREESGDVRYWKFDGIKYKTGKDATPDIDGEFKYVINDEVELVKILRDYVVGDLAERYSENEIKLDERDMAREVNNKLKVSGNVVSTGEKVQDKKGKLHYVQNLIMQYLEKSKKDELNQLFSKLKSISNEMFAKKFPEAAKEDENSRTKEGLVFLYFNHVIKPMFSIKYWQIKDTKPRKIAFYTVVVALPLIAMSIISVAFLVQIFTGVTILPGYLALYTLIPTLAALLYPILMGKVKNHKQKLVWGGIFGAFALLFSGLMVHLLLTKLALIIFNGGLVITLTLLFITAVPTLTSIYNIALAILSYNELQNDLWSKTAKSMTGWSSFNPFNINRTFSAVFSIGISLIIMAAITGFTLPAGVILAAATYAIVKFSPESRDEYWEKLFERFIKEFDQTEMNNDMILENGESVREYLIRFIHQLRMNSKMTSPETKHWITVIKSKNLDNGKLVYPQGEEARRAIFDVFMALSHKKPTHDVLALMEPGSAHTQAAWELFSNTPFNSMFKGIMNRNKATGEEGTLLGYVARNHSEWRSVIDHIRAELTGADSNVPTLEQHEFLMDLADVDENTDLIELIYHNSKINLSNKNIRNIETILMRFLNEMRPTQVPVVESMAKDIFEYHLDISERLGDKQYSDIIYELVVDRGYISLARAYKDLKDKTDRTGQEQIFVDKYMEYRTLIRTKMRNIIHMEPIWRDNKFSPKKDIEELGAIDEFIRRLPGIRAIAQEQGEQSIVWDIDSFLAFESINNYKNEGIDEWAEQFDRDMNESDGSFMAVRILYFAQQNISFDAFNKKDRDLQEMGLREVFDRVEQTAAYINTLIENDINYVLYDVKQDVVVIDNKNGGMAMNLWLFFENSVNYDAHVRTLTGQNIWRSIWLSMQSKNKHLAVVNPMMRTWASSSDAWMGTKTYDISVQSWTSDVQRARKGYTTFYGKGLGRYHVFTNIYTPPGEDSAAYLMHQRTQPDYESTNIGWYGFEWGRPAMLAESLVNTETRYAYNVVRILMDSAQFAVFHSKAGFDQKLSHLFMYLHYLVSPFSIMLLSIFALLVPFSGFAYLAPYISFAVLSMILMQAISGVNFVRHWRQSGNFWIAWGLLAKDIWHAFPFYVNIIANFVHGLVQASKEKFEFLRTAKDALLEIVGINNITRYEDTALLKAGKFQRSGLPLKGLVGLMGIFGFILAINVMDLLGALILLPYLYASIVMLTGIDVFAAHSDDKLKYDNKKGMARYLIAKAKFKALKRIGADKDKTEINGFKIQRNVIHGFKLSKVLTMLPFRIAQTLDYFWRIIDRTSLYHFGLKLRVNVFKAEAVSIKWNIAGYLAAVLSNTVLIIAFHLSAPSTSIFSPTTP